jgi:excinuclease UvrABC nuclease subunit
MVNGDEISRLLSGLKAELEVLDIEHLPGVRMDCEKFAERLPLATSGVYFLRSEACGLLYIGKATNIRQRWMPHPLAPFVPQNHRRFEDALDQGDVMLHYLELPQYQLATIESMLLQMHRPPWNIARG